MQANEQNHKHEFEVNNMICIHKHFNYFYTGTYESPFGFYLAKRNLNGM